MIAVIAFFVLIFACLRLPYAAKNFLPIWASVLPVLLGLLRSGRMKLMSNRQKKMTCIDTPLMSDESIAVRGFPPAHRTRQEAA
jgi:hypothetical protein